MKDRVEKLREKYEIFRSEFLSELRSIGLNHRLDEFDAEIFEDFERRFKMKSWRK